MALGEYAGYFFARAEAAAAVTVRLSLYDWQADAGLASTTVELPAGPGWAMHNFTLTPTKSTACASVQPRSPWRSTCVGNAEGLCPVCNGEFRIELVGAGAVLIDQVLLEPEWQKFEGQSTRSDVVAGMKEVMGFGVIRNGGSQCNSEGYRWKRFRGPAWQVSHGLQPQSPWIIPTVTVS